MAAPKYLATLDASVVMVQRVKSTTQDTSGQVRGDIPNPQSWTNYNHGKIRIFRDTLIDRNICYWDPLAWMKTWSDWISKRKSTS